MAYTLKRRAFISISASYCKFTENNLATENSRFSPPRRRSRKRRKRSEKENERRKEATDFSCKRRSFPWKHGEGEASWSGCRRRHFVLLGKHDSEGWKTLSFLWAASCAETRCLWRRIPRAQKKLSLRKVIAVSLSRFVPSPSNFPPPQTRFLRKKEPEGKVRIQTREHTLRTRRQSRKRWPLYVSHNASNKAPDAPAFPPLFETEKHMFCSQCPRSPSLLFLGVLKCAHPSCRYYIYVPDVVHIHGGWPVLFCYTNWCSRWGSSMSRRGTFCSGHEWHEGGDLRAMHAFGLLLLLVNA